MVQIRVVTGGTDHNFPIHTASIDILPTPCTDNCDSDTDLVRILPIDNLQYNKRARDIDEIPELNPLLFRDRYCTL